MNPATKNIFKMPTASNKKEIRILSKSVKPPFDIFDDNLTIINGDEKSDESKGDRIGDFFVTAEFGEKERIAKEKKKRKTFEKNRERAYKLLAKKEFILKKLASLDLSKKKHINDVADLNYKLEMIDWELNKIKEESGFDYISIQRISSIQKLMVYVKKKYKQFKKFICKHTDTIKNIVIGISTVIIPMIIGIMCGSKKPATT